MQWPNLKSAVLLMRNLLKLWKKTSHSSFHATENLCRFSAPLSPKLAVAWDQNFLWRYIQFFLFLIVILNWKGAPEGILDRCSHIRIGQNKLPISPEIRSQILALVSDYGTGADTLRCLALATHDEPTPLNQMNLQVRRKSNERVYKILTIFRIMLNLLNTKLV